jgi:hypothetical protein
MELITGFANPPRLETLNAAAMPECDSVEAAVAYVTDERTLIDSCMKNGVKLALWARYDYSIPVSEKVLQRFLDKRSPDYAIRIVPDIFHPKIIWWHGFGAYIGSANLTSRAWTGGIEAGLFLTDDELAQHGIDDGLTEFFQKVDARSYPVTEEFIAHVREIDARNSALHQEEANARKRLDEARRALGIEKLSSLFDITRTPSADRQRAAFLKEWNSTIQILRDIAKRVEHYRPAWVQTTAPPGAQADQFLHAYYYNRVKTGTENGFQKLYLQNRPKTEAALTEALEWWRELPGPPGSEKEMLEVRLPELQDLLQESRIRSLKREELAEVCLRVHAIYNHARQVSYESLGQPEPDQSKPAREKVREFGLWLYDQKSPSGRTALQTIHHVLFGGPDDEIPHRIFESSFNLSNKVPRLSVSSLGEIVGWVRPDFSPPRNNRTNKALRALGYDVKVYGE